MGGSSGAADGSPSAAAARADDVSRLSAAFLSTSARDLPLEEDSEYAGRWMWPGVVVELHVCPGGFHAFDDDPSASDDRQASRGNEAALSRAQGRRAA